MPDMHGPQLLSEVHRISPSTLAVLMSGYAEPGELPKNIPFLRKPFSPSELVKVVERTLQQAASARQALAGARAEAQKLRSERRKISDEIEETTRKSKDRTRKSREQFDRRREKPPE